MDSKEIADHLLVMNNMVKAIDSRAFVTMTVWPKGYHREGDIAITAHYIEHVVRSQDARDAIERMYEMIRNGSPKKPSDSSLARTLGLDDTPSWIDYPKMAVS